MILDSALQCSFAQETKPTQNGQPVPKVHVDYTTKSGFERLDALVPKEEAERLKKTPFAAIQVRRQNENAHSCMLAILPGS